MAMDFEAEGAKRYFQGAGMQWDAMYSHKSKINYLFNRIVCKDLFRRCRLTFEVRGTMPEPVTGLKTLEFESPPHNSA